MAATPGLGGLSLSALASTGHGETKRRTAGGLAQQKAGIATAARESAGLRTAGHEAQEREHRAARAQAAAQAALARREQAMRESAAIAAINAEAFENAAQRKHKKDLEGLANATWFDQQRFQTDENIRQQVEVARQLAQYETEDDGLPSLDTFGPNVMSPLRGAALNKEQPGQFDVSDADLQETAKILSEVTTPQELDQRLREYYTQKDGTGYRSRTASMALWELGYGLQG